MIDGSIILVLNKNVICSGGLNAFPPNSMMTVHSLVSGRRATCQDVGKGDGLDIRTGWKTARSFASPSSAWSSPVGTGFNCQVDT